MTNRTFLEFFGYDAATGKVYLSYKENGKSVCLDGNPEFDENNSENVMLLSMEGSYYGVNEYGRISPVPELIKIHDPVLMISKEIYCHHMGTYMQEFIDNYGKSDCLPLEIPISLNRKMPELN